jgi:hypothetical protein
MSISAALLAIRFSLDDYTDWYNSPKAALLFWACFTVVLLVIIGLMLFVFRRMRPH